MSTQSELDDLTARVNAIDGTNLTDPSLAVLTVLAAKINGLQTTIRQTTLNLESQLVKLQTSVDQLKTLLNTHLNP